MKDYNISQVAKMLNISSELLRHYERRGLINPRRDQSGYRVYTTADIYSISGIRVMRNAGYSLNDIEALHSAGHLRTMEIKQQHVAALTAEIAYKQQLLRSLSEDAAEFAALKANHDVISLTTSPAMVRINNQINDVFSVENRHLQPWIEHLPIVHVSPAFRKESLEKSNGDIMFGYAAPHDFALAQGLVHTKGAQIKTPVPCLTALVHSKGTSYLNARSVKPVMDYCRENNYTVTDEAWGITLGGFLDTDGSHIRYHRLYVPVEKQ